MLECFRQLISHDHGIILVTGPTGSGKSTTLYAALQEINSKEQNILTLEDPIEYRLEGISQTQVNEKKGMTFASGLRHVLRQDPDIIMVGEIRDRETARDGHPVGPDRAPGLQHAAHQRRRRRRDAAAGPGRRAVPGGQFADRRAGPAAGAAGLPVLHGSYAPGDAELATLGVGLAETRAMRIGRGCEKCRNTGYRGRLGTFELLVVDDVVRWHIQQRSTAADIRNAAIKAGMKTLREDGMAKVLAGVTTLAEVQRVTMRTASAEEAASEDDDISPQTGELPPVPMRDVPVSVGIADRAKSA